MATLAFAALKSVAFGWLGKMATKQFMEWVLLSAAEQYVKSTKTKADDKWFTEFKEFVTK